MTPEKIIGDLKKGQFKPVYWLEGDENYFIDQVVDYAEHKILSESEAGFNLTVFYGRDTAWSDVINACRRYPMFSEKQVVIIKEAQDLKGIDKLEAYVEKPLLSTMLFVAYNTDSLVQIALGNGLLQLKHIKFFADADKFFNIVFCNFFAVF